MLLGGHTARAARARTSWGEGFGQGGWFDIAWDYLETADDVWLVASAPLYSEVSL